MTDGRNAGVFRILKNAVEWGRDERDQDCKINAWDLFRDQRQARIQKSLSGRAFL